MARYTGPSCRQCRREGTKLFLKGTKCFTEKCPVERRPYAPGQHGQSTARRRKVSEYAKQLREKQKIKRIYGVSESQFRTTFERVAKQPGIAGHNLLAECPDETLEAIRLSARLEGMMTDPVYEGKSMQGMIDMIRREEIPAGAKVLYAHLGGVPAINGYSYLFRNG